MKKKRLGLILAILSPLYFEFIRQMCKKTVWAGLLIVPYTYVIILSGNKSSWFMLCLSLGLYLIFIFLSGKVKKIRHSHIAVFFVIVISGLTLINYTSDIVPDRNTGWIKNR